jgi:hypothetical protein
LFGYRTNRELLADMKKTAEGFDAGGRSFIYHRLVARGRSGTLGGYVLKNWYVF